MDRPAEHDTAWEHMLQQHMHSPRVEALVKALHLPLTPLAQSLVALASALDLDAAEGDRLDLIGSIVGVSRDLPGGIYIPYFGFASQPSGRGFGMARLRREGEPVTTTYTAPDPEYRSLIRAKIALNNSHGTAADLAAAAQGFYGANEVSVRDAGPARAEVWVGLIPSPEAPLSRVMPVLPRAAGVATGIVFYEPGRSFGFAGQHGAVGFGQGPLARTPPSNLAPI